MAVSCRRRSAGVVADWMVKGHQRPLATRLAYSRLHFPVGIHNVPRVLLAEQSPSLVHVEALDSASETPIQTLHQSSNAPKASDKAGVCI